MKRKVLIVITTIGVLLVGGASAGYNAIANGWKANSPESIQIEDGQKEYTMKLGDTLWAIGQKVNIKHEKLAEINGINLNAGEEYRLPVGRILAFDKNVVTVKNADGSIPSLE